MTTQELSCHSPFGLEGMLARAGHFMGLGRPHDALGLYASIMRQAPRSADGFAGFALACLRLNEMEYARDAAEQALAIDRAHAKAWFTLGAAYNSLGERANAIRVLEHAISLDPGNAEAQLVLGYAYDDADRIGDASKCYMRAAAANPTDARAYIALSSLHYVAGRPEEAITSAERALVLEPGNIFALQNMARFLSEAGREEEARTYRDRAYARNSIIAFTAPKPEQRVLVLTTTTDGNTPDRHLLPAARYTRLYWFIEYANRAEIENPVPHDIVFNAIADPDLAEATSANVEQFLAIYKGRIINDPRMIAQTGRHMTAALLSNVQGVEVPKTVKISAAETSFGIAHAAKRAGIELPFLVRPIGSHGGEGLQLADRGDAAALNVSPRQADHYLTAFRDFRSADGYYRKYRMFFVDRRPYPYHLAISPHWMVHYITAGMIGDEVRLAEEQRFLEDPEAALGPNAYRAVAAIGKAVDLDFCGLDFSLLPDGKVLVFEANATMLAHPEPEGGPFAHKNKQIRHIIEAFQALIAQK